MRLVLDLQGAQGENRARGIGRYSRSLAEALIRNGGDHEVIAVLNGRLSAVHPGLRQRLAELLPPERLLSWTPPAGIAALHPEGAWLRRACEAMRENFIAGLNPDILHISSLFEGLSEDAATSIGRGSARPACAVTLYDVIPALHPEIYLDPYPATERWYRGKLEHLCRADLWLAISQSTRREAIDLLGLPGERVLAIGAAVDAQFGKVSLSYEQIAGLRERMGLDRPFLLYTGGIDPRKNIDGLIRAFATLPSAMTEGLQLMLVCAVDATERSRLQRLAEQAGLRAGALVVSGFVDSDDLVALYNLCRLFVFPSWHEGFGLPALEAMACGAAVIAADSSSLPEVIGRGDALFPARDERAMAAKIHQVLNDDGLRLDLQRSGLIQAQKFSWDSTAKAALDGFARLATQARPQVRPVGVTAAPRPRLAYLSPLPPAQSGIADYSAELLPALARHYDIEVITDQTALQDPWISVNCRVRTMAWFERNGGRYDRILYHFGNSGFHHALFAQLERHPGMVVLHDFYLSGAIAYGDWTLGETHVFNRALYRDHGYGALAESFTSADGTDAVWKYPCSLTVLQQAMGIILHSRYARQLLSDWYGGGFFDRLTLIPVVRRPVATIGRAAARRSLGLTEADFLLCSFGLLGPTKLNDRLLNGFLASALGADPGCRLVFVGENDPGYYGDGLTTAIASSEAARRISITGYASPELYRLYLAAADLAVQLRGRSRGETSAALLDCLNYGVPTLANAVGAMAELPEDCLYRLPSDCDAATLAAALQQMRASPARRAKLAKKARAMIARDHAPDKIAALYRAAIERAYAAPDGLQATIAAAVGEQAPLPDHPDWQKLAESLAASFPPPGPVKQLLVDVSELVQGDRGSGIQRVVRNILAAWLRAPPPGYRVEPVAAAAGQAYRYARRFAFALLGGPCLLEDEIVQVAAGDCFLGLDLAPFVIPAQKDWLARLRATGVRTGFVVYDLLCVEMPDFFLPNAADDFARWLDCVSDADFALCISAATRQSLETWLAGHRPDRLGKLKLDHFRLGADFAAGTLPATLPQAWRERAPGPVLLMVGTIEPRKRHDEALAALEELWTRGHQVTLAIVGRIGWMTETLVERLRNHPERNRRLFWFESADDAELAALCGDAAGLLQTSMGEGFGLPLLEAAFYRLPILTRDLAVFREVAGDSARYFSGDLAADLELWLAELKQGRAPQSHGIEQPSWQDCARQLAALLPPPPPALTAKPAPTGDGTGDAGGSDQAADRGSSSLQLYPGYSALDVALLRRYATVTARVAADYFIDGFGVKTAFAHVPFCSGVTTGPLQLPVPDDGYHAEAIEYVAMVDSLDRTKGDSFTIAEIGAGWGPWLSLGGVLGRRSGKRAVTLIGVEADPQRFRLLARQLIDNQLRPPESVQGSVTVDGWAELGTVRSRLIEAAAGRQAGTLWFPKLDVADLGAAATDRSTGQDYRGATVDSAPVVAMTLAAILDGAALVDLLHVDIQGGEFDFLAANVDLLAARVGAMLVGTHSRVIEGALIELLLRQGWTLAREKPCRVDWSRQTPHLTGRTQNDGCQYWRRRP